ncbi:hypothetical protein [Paenibacillus vini]|uniref:Uncharacterized protein n=1 Tax=Paenibacillus vini TaxID=1476024 RepID=A0ABQ4MB90_9BACL|nr:hypothetical protein [Paenibacillus vini]GIP53242.1 hypothetical protein J42TS3_22770 [Paenibacillus vini]
MEAIIDLLNPSTTTGSLLIGIISGLISGLILGFFTGKKYESNKFTTKGNQSPIIHSSDIKVNTHDK